VGQQLTQLDPPLTGHRYQNATPDNKSTHRGRRPKNKTLLPHSPHVSKLINRSTATNPPGVSVVNTHKKQMHASSRHNKKKVFARVTARDSGEWQEMLTTSCTRMEMDRIQCYEAKGL
jgi:hypothetical protein